MARRKGFTIMELIVVLAIAVLILAISIVFFSPSAAKSRDARREQDMKSVQNALDLYINQKGTYPACAEKIVIDGNTDCLSSLLLSENTIEAVPIDPLYKGAGDCGAASARVYCYKSTDGLSYELSYDLETDSVQGKAPGWQTLTP
ncbi:MAG: type II secretion system protein [bacterium]|nr:type II secretion system protein [bacterium]